MTEVAPDCAMCNNLATMRCARCKCNNIYCSRPCQKADWKLHKILCSSRPQFETPPHKDARRGIVFLESGEIKFTWETTEMKTDEDDGTSWEGVKDIKEKYFISAGRQATLQLYYNNVIRGRKLKECINLWFDECFLQDESPKNKAVISVVPGMDDGGYDVWHGPLVALKSIRSYFDNKRQNLNSSPGYGHMDMGDFREVVDYLTNYKRTVSEDDKTKELRDQQLLRDFLGPGYNPAPAPSPPPSQPSVPQIIPSTTSATSKRVHGVRINCLGDVEGGRSRFEAISLTGAMLTDLKNAVFPELPARLGLPIQLKKLPPPAKLKKDRYQLQNQPVTFLHLSIDPKKSNFGWAPPQWQDNIGSVVVMRPDGKDLMPQHVEALWIYCYYFLNQYFQDSQGAGMDPDIIISRDEVMYQISPKAFELFFWGFQGYMTSSKKDDGYWSAKGVYSLEIEKRPENVKGLRENFHKLRKFL